MRCPYCASRDSSDPRICSNCGSILRIDLLEKRKLRPKIKRGAFLRMFTVLVAALLCGVMAFNFAGDSPNVRVAASRDIIALFGSIFGAGLVYVVSGIRTIYVSMLLQRGISSLEKDIRHRAETTKNRESAILDDDKAKDVNPQDKAAALVTRGTRLFLERDFEAAAHELEGARRDGSKGLVVENNLAAALFCSGKVQQALSLLESAKTVADGRPQVVRNLAHAFTNATFGNHSQSADAALRYCDEAWNAAPDDVVAMCRQGVLMCRLGRHAEGVQKFRDAVSRAMSTRAGRLRSRASTE